MIAIIDGRECRVSDENAGKVCNRAASQNLERLVGEQSDAKNPMTNLDRP
jgi:hypothetical protein